MTHNTNDPALPTPWPPVGPVDLRALVKNLAAPPGDTKPTTGEYRPTCVRRHAQSPQV